MEMKKSKSIFRIFLTHLVGLSLSIIALLIVTVFSVSTAFRTGALLPANYSETKLSGIAQALIADFDPNLLPLNTSYVVIDEGFGVIDSNMSANDKIYTLNYLSTGRRSYSAGYKSFTLSNKNILVVKYEILARFENETLNKIIPYPEIAILSFVFVSIVFFTIITALAFSKKLKTNLLNITYATEKIAAQDLDFEIEPTKITEFNTSLAAIDKLKNELRASLHKQWGDEQQKRLSLSALAHDIKTPLTVIKGNTELLLEDDLEKDALECVSYIKQSANTIEKYIETLMDVVNDNKFGVNKKNIPLINFINGIEEDALSLCKTKDIDLRVQNHSNSNCITIDSELVQRVIMNIMDNAVRYSNKGSNIDFIVSEDDAYFIFRISDSGKGFSPESLKKATTEFFTEYTARSCKHYGLGLSFAKKVADLHNGLLEFHNTNQGATVTLKLPK
ncbi:MAG: HAMP domain-containing sensor histidine kinase [Oscillospiraceae bacterium]